MFSPPPSFQSSQEEAVDVPVAAPSTPIAVAERAEEQVPGPEVREAVPAPPSLSSAVASKKRARSRHSIPVTQAQLEQIESTIPPAGAFLDTSTHVNFQVRTTKIALTYARCFVPLEEVFAQLATGSKAIRGMRGVIEPHMDGTPHVHVIVQKKNSAIPYRNFLLSYQNVVYRCDIRTLTTKKKIPAELA